MNHFTYDKPFHNSLILTEHLSCARTELNSKNTAVKTCFAIMEFTFYRNVCQQKYFEGKVRMRKTRSGRQAGVMVCYFTFNINSREALFNKLNLGRRIQRGMYLGEDRQTR